MLRTRSALLLAESTASWVPWGPPRPVKMVGDDRVGRLVLAPEDWSAGFDFDAMEEYLATWLREHPDVWISAIERAAAMQSRPHSHPLARRLDQASGPIARAEAHIEELVPPGPVVRDYTELPWRVDPHFIDPRAGVAGEYSNWLILLGGGLVGLAAGLAAVYVVRRRSGAGSAALGDRLAALESRMTDTQDVMIALSEKIDRMDARERSPGARESGS